MSTFPNINPVALYVGPLEIHWYGLAYIAGVILGWLLFRYIIKKSNTKLTLNHAHDFIFTWFMISMLVGGRLGHVLFYDFHYYFNHPLEILMTWKGGMSFHGGVIGIAIASLLFCHHNKLGLFDLTDVIVICTPFGLCFGRLANFINSELYGHITSVPWGIVFPNGGPLPRHPTQLYEAFVEGVLLFILLFQVWCKTNWIEQAGKLTGLFLVSYGSGRTVIEFFKEVDPHIGYFFHYFALGQLLCLPMIVLGLYLIFRKSYGSLLTFSKVP